MSSADRPAFQIRTSPFSSVPLEVYSMGERTVGRFGYDFARYFDALGAIQEHSSDSEIRVHVVLSAA